MTELPLADRSLALVQAWIEPSRSRGRGPDVRGRQLATLLADPLGRAFMMGFLDRVIRPDDHRLAARQLRQLSRAMPRSMPAGQRIMLAVGSVASLVAPRLVVTLAHRTLRRLLGHLVVVARPDQLGRIIAKLRSRGDRLDLSLLGEAVLGEDEAVRRRDDILALVEREDVDHVSVKISAVASQLSTWSFDASVERVVKQLTPLYAGAAAGNGTFITLDMEQFKDLDLTIAVFTRLMESWPDLEAGIVLQAYLPDALPAMQQLQDWAARRRAAGGAPIKVRLVKGDNLAMEHVDAAIGGWPTATWGSKRETDTHYKRILHWALTPERVDAVRIGIASQNVFDIAYAWLLAGDRGVREAIEIEMLLGLDGGPARAVRAEVGQLLLYTPVVRPDQLETAIAYLARRIEESASSPNNRSAAFELAHDPSLLAREHDRFLASVEQLDDPVASTHRTQNRLTEVPAEQHDRFVNTCNTDPAIAANRDWARLAIARAAYSQLGSQTVRDGRVPGPASLETILHDARSAAQAWSDRGAEVRAWILHQAGHALAARRGDLVSVMAAEAGKTVSESDAEVSQGVDLAHYYAESARRLDVVDGARFEPAKLTVVVSPWSSPVAVPAGSMLAALAVGSSVVLTPAPQARRSAAVVVEALWQAGVPRDVLRFVTIDEGPLSQALITHPSVDTVVLTGRWDTAALFRSWRADLPLLAGTSGKNAIVVTPSADLDLAVADLVTSAFGQAGQQCSAASLAIVVGSAADSARFERRLVDAVSSLRVGHPDDLDVTMGPVIQAPEGKLLEGLTTLDDGETWLLEPRQLGPDPRLWSPGIRTGVRPGSRFHRTEYFGPVLGIMHASTLAQAIEWQNATDFGLTAGIHSLDATDVAHWVDSVEAGNLYVNRGVTGAIVQRQPFGGWKRSSVGTTAKAGGPNYLAQLGTWHPRALRPGVEPVQLTAPVESILAAAAPHLSPDELAQLRAAGQCDHNAWTREYGLVKDVSAVGVERNLLRYRPVAVSIRFDGQLVDLVRVLLAAARTGAPVTVSTSAPLPEGLASHVVIESMTAWLASAQRDRPGRVRLIGSAPRILAEALGGDPDVAIYADPVTLSGRVEALPFLREQSVSITHHRFGHLQPDLAFARLLPVGQPS